ncbi:MAG: DUF4350 domain-containing protein [Bacteroidales bacterium]|nr:DUF4350 domain-containing protein [Bacteroidales bacterium]
MSTFLWFIPVFISSAQQVPDTNFTLTIRQPAYQKDSGPLVLIDQAHHNMHTKNGGFLAFSRLLEQDGYRVRSLQAAVNDLEVLNGCKILVIANALDSSNLGNWVLPTPSAFSKEEISMIRSWVKNGGSLFLIADHMPFAGAASKLGKAFGFEFINGFAFTGERTWPPSEFSVEDETLPTSPVVTGIRDYEKTDKVVTFTGSAFYTPDMSTPVLSFLEEHRSLQPDTAWRFNAKTRWQDLKGFHQGAILKYGKGKIAVFGEAAMFTAQIVNGNVPVGFNSDVAPQNAQFTLNVIHWLDEVKEYHGKAVTNPAK